MKRENILLWGLAAASGLLMSVPYLVPHTGFLALIGLIPLLCMERIATIQEKKHVWMYHYFSFVLWNTITTFWVCNATVGGGIFAILANSFQMSVVFGLFRWSRRRFKGALPYIFLMTAWIAWERFYFDAEISWPWLVLGNAFARSTGAIQWYEFTGTLGGSLWIWASNLSLFGILVSLSDGSWHRFNSKAKAAAISGCILLLSFPPAASLMIGAGYRDAMNEGEKLECLVIQPNIDPYNKFEFLRQSQQNDILLSLAEKELVRRDTSGSPLLIVAPETFTNDITVGHFEKSRTWNRFTSFLKDYPDVNLLFGASSYEYIQSGIRPSHTARKISDGLWYESHNSALMTDGTARTEIFHKSKLVVAVEKTPYPALFCKIDDMLGGVMGRCIGQDQISLLNVQYTAQDSTIRRIPVGCAVCYESVYGEYYTDYVRNGAQLMTIITNDAWWGNTPGYRQHLSYACLRAIETRRAIARCANTGISAIISPSGEITEMTSWWTPATLKGQLPLRDDITFFVAHGDITGRICTFLFLMLLLALAVRFRAS